MRREGKVRLEPPPRRRPQRSPAGAFRSGDACAPGFVEQGVATAYRVYEEYMRRGRSAACEFGGRWAATTGTEDDMRDPMSITMAYWAAMARSMWGFGPPGGDCCEPDPCRPRRKARCCDEREPRCRDEREPCRDEEECCVTSVEIKLTTPQGLSASAHIHLEGDCACDAVHVGRLSLDGDPSRTIASEHVEVEVRDSKLEITVTVPENAYPGTYRAKVNSRGSKACGKIRVDVKPSGQPNPLMKKPGLSASAESGT